MSTPAPPVIRKHDAAPGSTRLEALGLVWLAEAMPDGGAPVVPVRCGEGWLEEPRLRQSRPTPAAARAFGRALARTHAAGAGEHGAAPPGWEEDSGWMGAARLPLRPGPAPSPGTTESGGAPAAPGIPSAPGPAPRRWGEFYAEDRLLPYLGAARANGSLDASGARLIERVAGRLASGLLDADQPALVSALARERGGAPDAARLAARTHGDLWSGNVLWVARSETASWAPAPAVGGPMGGPGTGPEDGPLEGAPAPGAPAGGERRAPDVVGVLIDPAAQGGHAETDLAELGVFSQPHLDQVYAGYEEVSALAAGWRERVGAHQLHMLIIHAALFGGGYGVRTVATARRYA
ncbi:fructosamine kinase family protein [Actinomyces dentalis]|uniref:fructosamine kinase family protein n=1 Tax=Actinomyces dentalis TaxID=272548 RepID=UPI002354B9B0|nr:fructosamine kinase family protein [Actinomyces dentalis]